MGGFDFDTATAEDITELLTSLTFSDDEVDPADVPPPMTPDAAERLMQDAERILGRNLRRA